MRALIEGPDLSKTPHLESWLSLAHPVRDNRARALFAHPDRGRAGGTAGRKNVLFALENLTTYPCVAKRLKAETLSLHAWYFKSREPSFSPTMRNAGQFLPSARNGNPASTSTQSNP